MDFNERIAKLNKMIADARKIVFFTGAGISTGSGIPDFRSTEGLYTTSQDSDPEYMLSSTCLQMEPQSFFKYLRNNMDFRNAEPNIAHRKISELQLTKDVSVITQNIDGLHEKAGSEKIYAIHGTMARYMCTDCQYDLFVPEDVMDGNYDNLFEIPKCPLCGEGVIRPDIVLYGEGMAHPAWQNAMCASGQADLLIVVGTSLTVYPAAYIPMYAADSTKIIVINRERTNVDNSADIVFHEDIKDVFEKIEIPKE